MIKIRFIALLVFTTLITSCSSNDDDKEQIVKPSTDGTFELLYNNEAKKVDSWKATKIDDFMQVTGQTSDGIAVDLRFNIFGNLYKGSTQGTATGKYEISEVFTSDTFAFTIEELNTTKKTVKVKFSGKLYANGYDYKANYITSPTKFIPVSGLFTVAYSDLTPSIPGLGTFAQLNGKDWHGMSLDSSIEIVDLNKITTLNVENDGQYSLGIVFPQGNLKVGTFPFTTNASTNRISFKKFDLATHTFIIYNVTGTVIYTAVNDTYVEGTFSLTATNPIDNSKIVITNGKFKEGR